MHTGSRHRPVVLIPACTRLLGDLPYLVTSRKYAMAVRLAGALPLMVPAAEAADVPDLLALADGVLLTGSPSNVHPSHYGEDVLDPSLPLDPDRDGWTLPVIREAIRRRMPLLAICRGFQEINVALGGSLHQAVHQVGPYRDHRANESLPVEQQFATAHPVAVQPGGLLERCLGHAGTIEVNSLHGQGVNQLAEGLRIEAIAPDGLVEAFSLDEPREGMFLLGVQWHPEWEAASNPVSMAMLRAFGAACQSWRDLHRPPSR